MTESCFANLEQRTQPKCRAVQQQPGLQKLRALVGTTHQVAAFAGLHAARSIKHRDAAPVTMNK